MIIILKLDQKVPTRDEILKEIEYYKERIPTLKSLLEFYGAIIVAQSEYASRVDLPSIDVTEEEIKTLLREGKPVLTGRRGEVSPVLYRSMLEEIVGIVKEKSPKPPRGLDKLMNLNELKTEKIPTLIEKLEGFDEAFFAELGEKSGTKKETVLFIATAALIPFYEAYAKVLREKINQHFWGKEFCPICGRRAFMARLRREDGLRLLRCSMCRSDWWVQNIKCAFCGTEDNKSLPFFYPEDDKGHRIDVCDECKRYIKTSNEKELGREVTPEVEDAATIFLDTVAQKKGYSPVAQLASEMH
ncbi:MAG: formate dehydrogenase accessory protein FdhE [Actinomycetota bacterium]|nr:formate dehydrogenase accessory protein FdhE [Actinomycetota bacterium]